MNNFKIIGKVKHIWLACEDCGRERWVRFVRGKPLHQLCFDCIPRAKHRENHPRWNGGIAKSRGYIFIYMPEHPHANNRKYVKRARLVLEAKLNRYLLPNMDTHHINGIKDNDRPKNLMELSRSEHAKLRNQKAGFRRLRNE